MKEKPILFSTPMVQALLNTKPNTWPAEPIDPSKPHKWMTRRVIKGKASLYDLDNSEPRYYIGDHLWARETFTKAPNGDYIYRADPIFDGCGKGDISWDWTPSRFMPREAARIFLEVKGVRVERVQDITERDAVAEGVSPFPLMMLKQLPTSLICPGGAYGKGYLPEKSYKAGFYKLWDDLNAKRGYSWDSNPCVYVYEFMRVK